MVEINPFYGIRYNPAIISDLSRVICPPYDIIDLELQNKLYEISEYNFVRIEYNRELPQDTMDDNRYTRAASCISRWLQENVFIYENRPAIYIHHHNFSLNGKSYVRRNLITLVKLEEWETRKILPHENIMSKPKSDRLNMLWTCHANTSPVLALYEDPGRAINSTLSVEENGKPEIDIYDIFGERHQVWVVTRPEIIQTVKNIMREQPLYIADGHHRYDSALTFRKEKILQQCPGTGEEGYNYIMMSLVSFDDAGLVILPTHRLVRGISRSVLNSLRDKLNAFFDIEEIDTLLPDFEDRVDQKIRGITAETDQIMLAIYGLKESSLLVLKLRSQAEINNLMPKFHGEIYHKLDISLVDHVILANMLGLSSEQEQVSLAYSHDWKEAIKRIRNQEYQLLFILNPVKPDLIKAIANEGDRMPRKSTYFYPKSPAGLVFYQW